MSHSKTIRDNDVEIEAADQQKINEFARLNNKFEDTKLDLNRNKKELQNLQDAADELILMDDTEPVPLQIGEIFLNYAMDDALAYLELQKSSIQIKLVELESVQDNLKQQMSKLKIELYAKFNNSINLEYDDE